MAAARSLRSPHTLSDGARAKIEFFAYVVNHDYMRETSRTATALGFASVTFEPFTREWSSPWPETNRDPLIVLSFSTSYMDQQALAQRALDAVAGLPVRALLTAGPALDAQALRIPANTRAVAHIPHRAVFPHAALVVTHAGWQTVNAALADGVPLVCIPDGRDQPDNAARVLACGAGVRVRKNVTVNKLRQVIARALTDAALKQSAEQMADALAIDGALEVAERVERIGVPTSP